MDSIRRSTSYTFNLGVYYPTGSLAIDSLGSTHVPAKIMVLWWGCCWECGEFRFTCQCAQMKWVPNTRNVCNTYSSTLWHIPWQDWTRFNTYGSNLKSQHTQSDCSTHPSTQIIVADPPVPLKTNHLLGPKPSEVYTNRSNWVTGRKYPKLCRYSQWIFPSNRATSTWRAGLAMKLDFWFLGGCRCFATVLLSNSIRRPHRRSTLLSGRSLKSPIVAYLPITRRRRHISVQL